MIKISNPIKIAFVIGQLALGGTEIQLLELVRHLNQNKFKILVVSLSSQAPLTNLFLDTGCEVRTLNREKKGRLAVFLDLYHSLDMFKPDIVHSYAYASRAAIPISKILVKCKSIVSIRTQPGRQDKWWDYLFNSFADYILTNSKKSAESIHFGFCKNVPCQVVYNGIDLYKFDSRANSYFALKSTLDSRTRILCVVARLHPVKGLNILLDAFKMILEIFDNIQLWVVGDGPDREKLELQAKQLKVGSKVVFWGQQENIPSILRYVAVGVLSSHVEGLPNAIIEYMAAGLPVVATNVGGISELVTHKATGLLVEPENPEELARAILVLLKDEGQAERFGKNGRKFVEQYFDLKRMVNETEAIYNKLLALRDS